MAHVGIVRRRDVGAEAMTMGYRVGKEKTRMSPRKGRDDFFYPRARGSMAGKKICPTLHSIWVAHVGEGWMGMSP